MNARSITTLFLAGWLVSAAGSPSHAFTFSKVTDLENPIVADGGHGTSRYFGATWIDYDQDGDLDLFLDQNLLYRNDGESGFVRVLDSGLGEGQIATPGFSMSGISWGDYDNDGDPDCFIAGEASYLYRNDNGGRFTRIEDGPIGGGTVNRGWTCAWGDYDSDGDLDLVIVHPAGFVPGGPALPNMMFRNDGAPDYGFTQIFDGPIVEGLDSYTVGTWSDFDADGDLDFFIGSGPANGTLQPDNLYRNLLTEDGTAEFERISDAPVGTDDQDGQVWNWIDYDNDGDLDAYVTNWGGSLGGLANRLYRQENDGSFTAVIGQTITNDISVSLGSVWEDFDNDGDLDCWVGNDGNRSDALYENDGSGTFTKRTGTPVTATTGPSRGSSAGDFDGDGDIDLFVNGPSTNRALYRNEDTTGNGWLDVDLYGTVSNASGIGARIRTRSVIGGSPVWQMREVSGQNTFNGHSAQIAHFGLGDAAMADSVVVEWPSGLVSVVTEVPASQKIVVVEGGAADAPPSASVGGSWTARLLLAAPSPFDATTTIGFALAVDGPVQLTVHDASGRLVHRLVSGDRSAGSHLVAWDGRDATGELLPSGSYRLRLAAAGSVDSRQVVFLR